MLCTSGWFAGLPETQISWKSRSDISDTRKKLQGIKSDWFTIRPAAEWWHTCHTISLQLYKCSASSITVSLRGINLHRWSIKTFSVITTTLVTRCTALCVDPVDSCTENCRLFSRAVSWETWLSLSVVFSIKVGSEWWNLTFGIWDQQCRAQHSDVTEAATPNAVERCTGRSPWSRGQPHLNLRIYFFFFFFRAGSWLYDVLRETNKNTVFCFGVFFFLIYETGNLSMTLNGWATSEADFTPAQFFSSDLNYQQSSQHSIEAQGPISCF